MAEILSKTKTRNLISIFILLVTAGIGIGMIWFPHISDDLKFLTPFADYVKGNSSDLSRAFKDGVIFWLNNENIRISNLIAIFLLWLPPYVSGIITTVAIWVIIKKSVTLARISTKPLAVIFFVMMFLVFYPWTDQLYLTDFQINYIWATAISLFIVSRLTNSSSNSLASLVILCFILGWFHEGFGGGIAALLLSLIVFFRRFRNLKYLLCLLALIPGIAVIGISQLNSFDGLYFADRQNILYLYSLPALIFIFLTLIYCGGNRKRSFLQLISPNTDLTLFSLLFLSVSGTLLMLMVPTGPRSGSLGIIASLIGISYILPLLPFRLHAFRNRGVRYLLSIIFLSFIFCHIVLVDIECIKAYKTTQDVVRRYMDNPSKPIYADMTLRSDAGVLCLQKPYYDWFAHEKTIKVIEQFYGDSTSRPLIVIPKELESIDLTRAVPIAGNAGLYRYGHLLFGPAELPYPYVNNLEVIEDGTARRMRYYVVPFNDGRPWAWYYPDFTTLSLFNRRNVTINY